MPQNDLERADNKAHLTPDSIKALEDRCIMGLVRRQ